MLFSRSTRPDRKGEFHLSTGSTIFMQSMSRKKISETADNFTGFTFSNARGLFSAWRMVGRAGLLFSVVGIIMMFGAGTVRAEYTNICGSGVGGTTYSCPANCSLDSGVCTGAYVVKWTCDGRQTKCEENESAWTTSQNVKDVPCGKTAQVDVFDKNCREGGWSCDDSNLKGYLVYYGGNCPPPPTPTPTPTPRPTPTATPTPTPTPRPTPTPTPTPGPTPTPQVLGAVTQTTPKTGAPLWIEVAGLGGLAGVGWKLRKAASKFWV